MRGVGRASDSVLGTSCRRRLSKRFGTIFRPTQRVLAMHRHFNRWRSTLWPHEEHWHILRYDVDLWHRCSAVRFFDRNIHLRLDPSLNLWIWAQAATRRAVDIFFVHQRGLPLSIYLAALFGGSFAGPVLSGYLTDIQTLGWVSATHIVSVY